MCTWTMESTAEILISSLFIATGFFWIRLEGACQLDNCSFISFLDGIIRSWLIFVSPGTCGLLLLSNWLKLSHRSMLAGNLKRSRAMVTKLFIKVFRTESCLYSYLFEAHLQLLKRWIWVFLWSHKKQLEFSFSFHLWRLAAFARL